MGALRIALALLFSATSAWPAGLPVEGAFGAAGAGVPIPGAALPLEMDGSRGPGRTAFDAAATLRSASFGTHLPQWNSGVRTHGLLPGPAQESSWPVFAGAQGEVRPVGPPQGASISLLPGWEALPAEPRLDRDSSDPTSRRVARIAQALGFPAQPPVIASFMERKEMPRPAGLLAEQNDLQPPPGGTPLPPPPKPAQGSDRLLSLDVFRGMTIAGMVLVNSPGNEQAYAVLRHAAWHGWTGADLVFPSFLVIMGVSLAISLSRRAAEGGLSPAVAGQIAKRSGLLYGLGLLINAFSPIPGGQLRLLGVLPRIAIASLCGSLLFLGSGPAVQALTAVALLAGYWALLTFVPVPGIGPGVLSAEGNLASWLDRLVMPGHLSQGIFDNEGLLSSLPAVATTIIGLLAGRWLLSGREEGAKTWGLLGAGTVLAALGLLWGQSFPINKILWTSSYALFTGGIALAGLAVTTWGARLKGSALFTKPFEVFGRNPLLAYFLSGALYQLQDAIPMRLADGTAGNLRLWLVQTCFGWLAPANASLAYSLSYVLAFLGLMAVLYRRKIFVKL